ncbi:MAG TPA: ABC transporter permease [Dehalococcoidia bacterium]|nr:ABC transporter permease [Dehalococcoidia bacterium]
MIAFILSLTLRELVSRKSTLLLLGLAAIPPIIALIFRLSDPSDVNPERWTARVLFIGLMVTAVLPLTALLFGTTVIGDEIEDGTAVYLLTKPVPRWQILLPKLTAAWIMTCALLLPSTLIAGFLALNGRGDSAIVLGFAVAVPVGALAYNTVFVMLSVVTSRALIAGLIYVFIWEGAITGIFAGTRYMSIRHYTIGIAGWIADPKPLTFDPYVGSTAAIVLIAVVTLVAGLVANRRLQRLEVREST